MRLWIVFDTMLPTQTRRSIRLVSEDYTKAFEERSRDVSILADAGRCIGAMHLGGMAVECRLKMLILEYHRIAAFGEHGARPKDARLGEPIVNPEHGLVRALKDMRNLWVRARRDTLFLRRLNTLIHPLEAMHDHRDMTYVSIRYTGAEPDTTQMDAWLEAWRYVIGWLQKNLRLVWGER